jgi:hypothetical protein
MLQQATTVYFKAVSRTYKYSSLLSQQRMPRKQWQLSSFLEPDQNKIRFRTLASKGYYLDVVKTEYVHLLHSML